MATGDLSDISAAIKGDWSVVDMLVRGSVSREISREEVRKLCSYLNQRFQQDAAALAALPPEKAGRRRDALLEAVTESLRFVSSFEASLGASDTTAVDAHLGDARVALERARAMHQLAAGERM